MIKLSTSYSKKVPVPGQEYSSHSFHCSMEMELSDGLGDAEIRGRIHESAELLRQAVDAELEGMGAVGGADGELTADMFGGGWPGSEALAKADAGSAKGAAKGAAGGGSVRMATNKQTKYLLDIVTAKGRTLAQFEEYLRQKLGVDGLYKLTAQQASELIEELQPKRQTRRKAA